MYVHDKFNEYEYPDVFYEFMSKVKKLVGSKENFKTLSQSEVEMVGDLLDQLCILEDVHNTYAYCENCIDSNCSDRGDMDIVNCIWLQLPQKHKPFQLF